MTPASESSACVKQVAPSTPGGQARQFRVQYRSLRERTWRLYACFRSPDQAEACVRKLLRRGENARMIGYRFCPTAG